MFSEHDLENGKWTKLSLVLCVCIILGYYYQDSFLNIDPRGIHFIRQTDSIAFVRFFELGHGSLLRPGILNLDLAPDEGRAAAEFPIIYWLISKLGAHHTHSATLRYINLLLVAAGQVIFLFAAKGLLRNTLLTMALGTWMLSSSVLAYYSLNYLPDAAAYGLVLMGWSSILPNAWGGALRGSAFGAACLTLAALIKAPASMHLVACMLILSQTGLSQSWMKRAMPHAAGLLLCTAWHAWVNIYNAEARTTYFLTHAMPIWKMSSNEIAATSDMALRYWWTKYLHPSIWHALAIILIILVFRHRGMPHALRGVLTWEILGSMAFLALFFPKLADHDYYFITILPTIGLVMLAGLGTTWHTIPAKPVRAILLLGAFSLGVAGTLLARTELKRRHDAPPDKYSATGAAMRQYLSNPTVPELPLDARVVVLGDASPHGALSALGRLGWSYPGYPESATPDWETLRAQGATHILRLHGWPMAELPCMTLCSGPSFELYRIIQP